MKKRLLKNAMSRKRIWLKVFNEITKQTGYDFLYNYDLVQNKGTVDVNAKMVDLKDFLHDLLKGKNLGFEFRDGAIIVRGESVRLDDQKIKSRTKRYCKR